MMWRTAIVVAVVGTVGFTVPVRGQEVPQVVVEPKVVVEGGEVKVDGTGFRPGTARLFVDGVDGKPLAELEHEGQFNFLLEISGVTPGVHSLIACNEQARDGSCRELAADSFTVEPPPTTTRPPRTTTTTKPPRATTTTKPPRATTTTSRPAPTTPPPTSPPAPGSTAPPSVTIAPTDPPLAVVTTLPPIPTIPPVLGGPSTTVGPDPTFDPSADGLAVATTTTVPGVVVTGADTDFPDLWIDAIEVSQGIQDLENEMPLVADRTTWVRVHVDSTGLDAWPNVDGALLLERSGVADMVIVPENGPISTKLPRTDPDSALNFVIPDEFLESGLASITAAVWSFQPSTVDDLEPFAENNVDSVSVYFWEASEPTIWLVALDDGGGPGPVVDDLTPLLGFAQVVHQDLLDFHPTATVDYEAYPEPVAPGPEALEPGIWNLGLDQDLDDPDGPEEETAGSRRHEPNIRMAWLLDEVLDDANVLGWVDPSIPTDVYSGWAGYGVAWNKPNAGTPAHELGHSRGLAHVGCKDDDGDGVADEISGGSIDPSHPTGLPHRTCSLAPIDPDGFFGLTTERPSLTVYSNDPDDPDAAFPFMSYESPGWTDAYHWCKLLQAVDVPCSPQGIGVPPVNLGPAADCTPEPAGGFGLDLCVSTELPDPFAQIDPGVAPFGVGESCGGAVLVFTQTSSPVACTDVAGTGIAVQFPNEVGGPAAVPIAVPAEPQQWLVVAGWVDTESGAAEIRQLALRDEISERLRTRYVDAVRGVLAGVTPMTHVVALTADASGEQIQVQVPLDIDGAGHGDGTPHASTTGFVQAIPVPALGCCFIELKGVDGESAWTGTISPSAPSVDLVSAQDVGDATLLEWSASDPDPGTQLTYDVAWSADGERWWPVASGIADDSIEVGHEVRFPGGDDVVVRVTANDGVRTGSALSDPFSAPTHDPQLFVTGLGDGVVEQHEAVELQVQLLDPETDGVDAESVSWTSDVDGALAGGRTLRTRDLSVGSHSIVVTASDAEGNEVTHVVSLSVVERTTPSRYGEEPAPGAVEMLRRTAGAPGAAGESSAGSAQSAPAGEASDGNGADSADASASGIAGSDDSSTWAPWAIAAGAVGLAGGVLVSRRRTDGSGRAGSRTGP